MDSRGWFRVCQVSHHDGHSPDTRRAVSLSSQPGEARAREPSAARNLGASGLLVRACGGGVRDQWNWGHTVVFDLVFQHRTEGALTELRRDHGHGSSRKLLWLIICHGVTPFPDSFPNPIAPDDGLIGQVSFAPFRDTRLDKIFAFPHWYHRIGTRLCHRRRWRSGW